METNDISIRKLNLNLGMSEETFCFKADLIINGKKRAVVENNGKGEATRFYWNKPEYKDEFSADESPIEDVIIKHLTQEAIKRDKANAVRKTKRMLADGLYFTRVGSDGRWFAYTKLKTADKWAAAREKLSKITDVEKVLNDIPFDEAFPYFFDFSENEQGQ
jgi:hypothetical protein